MNDKPLKFRYDINALRAIAVISVILYHYRVGLLEGGFAGVDIFFVISGFLMTSIIFTSLEKNKFSYLEFLTRRALRIVPALIAMVTLVTAVEFLSYFPWNLKTSSVNGIASLLFYSNLKYIRHGGYFDAASSLNIYLHTWSLSVEFQFYLLYPFLLMGLKSVRTLSSRIVQVLAVLTVLSFSFSVWLTYRHPDASFYLLPTRAWELAAGGIVLLIGMKPINNRTRLIISIAGYIVLLGCLIILRQEMKWPGFFTLLPVLATSGIILANKDFPILKSGVIQFAGKISYSLYLWHWPVFVLGQYLGVGIQLLDKGLLVIVTLILAIASWYFIESRKIETRRLAWIMGIVTVLVFICSKITVNEFLFRRKTLEVANYMALHNTERSAQFSEGKCFIVTGNFTDYKKDPCLRIADHQKNLLLIGDSHAAELSQSLRIKLATRKINLLQATASGCLPLRDNRERGSCAELNDFIYNDFIVQKASKLKGVILNGDWSDAPDKSLLIAELANTIRYLKKMKLNVIIIGQTEGYIMPYSEIAAREYQYNINLREQYLNEEAAKVNELLKHNFQENYVDIYNYLKVPPMKNEKVPYIFDLNHLSKYGADLTVSRIVADSIMGRLIEN